MENLNFEKLSNQEMRKILGGRRIVTRIDVDGDGRWDMKFVSNPETGRWKCKVR